jgi:hypothetical protein
MESEPKTIDIYWTVQRGRRFTISLSERAAWDSLNNFWAYDEDPHDWTVEHTREEVPVAVGEIYEGGDGEMIELDEDGHEVSRAPYIPVKVIWNCPRCGELHLTDLYDDRIERTGAAPNPSLWYCERGQDPVLVRW